MARVDEIINDMIIWESGDMPEVEKKLIVTHTKFKYYDRIAYTVSTGKYREFGVFRRDNNLES